MAPWLVVVVLVATVVLAAQDRGRVQTEAQARRVNDRIRTLQSEADRLATEARSLLGELRALEIEQELQAERVREAQAASERGRAAVDATAARLATLEQQRLSQLPDLKVQLVDIYKRGRTGYARLLFGSTSARDFGRALRAVSALVRIYDMRVTAHRRTLEDVRRQRAALEKELRALEAKEADARRAEAAADRALAARAKLLAQIDARRDLTAQLAGELQLAYDRLQQQLAAAVRGATPETVDVPLTLFRGGLEWPVAGPVLVPFGQPSGRSGDSTVRNGVEIAAAAGTPVHAIHPGTVSYAEPLAGLGNVLILDHGSDAYSVYGYLESIAVARGVTVDAGTELGRVGSAPAGPPALYFEVRVDGRSVDPLQWLRPR
ncbi:MAG: peptidoglycan DD-metalloendopeptidase family protein [Acidobacteria bacterium]|nr:peptidoglycan DD-metalloendopeptidase family protein [Acidobacteriota bacterium]